MRVLHCLDEVRLEKGGVVRAVLDLVSGVAARLGEQADEGDAGVDVTLLTADPADTPTEWGDGGPHVEVIDWGVTPWLKPRHAAGRWREAIAKADLVHLHMPWLPLNPWIAAEARRQGKPYVLSVHGMLDDWCVANKRWKKRLFLAACGRRMLEKAAWIHFTAEAERDQAVVHAPGMTTLVAPLLMDLSPYDNLPGPAEALATFPGLSKTEEPRLLFLSRVDPKKGIDLLIEAVARLLQDGQPTQAFIAGPGEPAYVASLQALAARLGVTDRVHFLGMVKGSLKWSLYQACDAFVLPTHQENFGIVLVEAMGCGLPTVTTRGVDIWRELQRCNATIVDDTAEAVTSGVGDLLKNPEQASKAARLGREELFAWLDPARLAEQYRAAYEAALCGEAPG